MSVAVVKAFFAIARPIPLLAPVTRTTRIIGCIKALQLSERSRVAQTLKNARFANPKRINQATGPKRAGARFRFVPATSRVLEKSGFPKTKCKQTSSLGWREGRRARLLPWLRQAFQVWKLPLAQRLYQREIDAGLG